MCRPFRSHSCSAVHALTCVSISQIVQGYLLLSFARFLSISCISVLAICFSLCSHKPTGVSQFVLCFLSAALAMLVRDLDVLFHYIIPRFDVTSVSPVQGCLQLALCSCRCSLSPGHFASICCNLRQHFTPSCHHKLCALMAVTTCFPRCSTQSGDLAILFSSMLLSVDLGLLIFIGTRRSSVTLNWSSRPLIFVLFVCILVQR